MCKTFCCLFFLLAIQTIAFPQDSVTNKKVDFKLSAYLWMENRSENNAQVSMPVFIKQLRRNTTTLPISFDNLTDNPLIHGATYLAVKSSASYRNKAKLNIDLYAEHRGASYGVFNKDNLFIYPVISIDLKDSFKISKQKLCFIGKVGMFLDEKMDEGLTIYNIDGQGVKVAFELNRWALQATLYGDFLNGIGLRIDDVYALAFKRKTGRKKNAEIGVSLNINKVTGASFKNSFTLNLFGHKDFGNSKLYAQVGCRPVSSRSSFFRVSSAFSHTMAAVLGMEHHSNTRGFTFRNTLELRYYGSIFNDFHNDFTLRYRQPAANTYEMYGNTVGKYIYPLRKFNTAFSQWAVYTEYINHSIFSVNLRGYIDRELGKKISVNLGYDLNYIHARDNFNHIPVEPLTVSNFFYPFFKAGITYRIIKGIETSLILTNQSMNLDVAYPTYYLLSRPAIGINLTASF